MYKCTLNARPEYMLHVCKVQYMYFMSIMYWYMYMYMYIKSSEYVRLTTLLLISATQLLVSETLLEYM